MQMQRDKPFQSPLRLVFMGSPQFALPSLQRLVADTRYHVAAVYTQPPRPKNRGQRLEKTPVHQWAEGQGIPVFYSSSLRSEPVQAELKKLQPDVIVVVAYGLLLPKAVLEIPPLGCVNVHGSLLPRWRGAAPIQRAILAGDTQTGITLMQMEEGLDTGPYFAMDKTPITPETTFQDLHDALGLQGADLLQENLLPFAQGDLPLYPQPSEGITYAAKIEKAEAGLDWNLPATELERKIRALNPTPGTWCWFRGKRLKILKAEVESVQGNPGNLLDQRMLIACGKDALRPLTLMPEGGKVQALQAFLNGHTLKEDDLKQPQP